MLVSESDLPRGSEWKVQDETAKTGISDIYFSIQGRRFIAFFPPYGFLNIFITPDIPRPNIRGIIPSPSPSGIIEVNVFIQSLIV